MKALCIADIHGDREAVDRVSSSLMGKDFDYVFLLGDFSRGFKDPTRNNRDILYALEAFNGLRVKAIPGNCDQRASIDLFAARGANLHETVLELAGHALIGLGGSNPTPFDTPFELSEEEIYDHLSKMFTAMAGKRTILLTHFPPKDTLCDELPGGVHVGSESLRKIIEEHGPEIVLCSHIHESGGRQDKIGQTQIVNVGRLSDGRAIVLDIGEKAAVSPYTG
ncbi:metallophosphoesterase [Candidatus Altiarchaeota archaeon]